MNRDSEAMVVYLGVVEKMWEKGRPSSFNGGFSIILPYLDAEAVAVCRIRP